MVLLTVTAWVDGGDDGGGSDGKDEDEDEDDGDIDDSDDDKDEDDIKLVSFLPSSSSSSFSFFLIGLTIGFEQNKAQNCYLKVESKQTELKLWRTSY